MKLLRFLTPLMVIAVAGCAAVGPAPDAAVLTDLAPTGKLRFGVAFAPEPSTFFVAKGADGQPSGVAVDLARDLGRQLGRPVEFLVAPNSGQLTDALVSGKVDAALMPVDAERRKKLGIGPIYFIGENTYLVRPGANIRTLADVDQGGMRVVGIANTTTIRAVGAMLKNTKITPVPSVDEALGLLRAGQADAFALTRDTLAPLVASVPGSRILDGAFRKIDFAVVLPKDKPQGLAYATQWMNDAKANGTVRKAFDAHGFKSAAVAPADAR